MNTRENPVMRRDQNGRTREWIFCDMIDKIDGEGNSIPLAPDEKG